MLKADTVYETSSVHSELLFYFIEVHVKLMLCLQFKMNSHSIAKYQQYYWTLCLCTKHHYELSIQSLPETWNNWQLLI